MACTTVAAPSSAGVETSKADPIKTDTCDGASASSEKAKVSSRQKEKRKIYQQLKSLTPEEEKKGVFVTQADLISWAKRLTNNNVNKPENALEILRWMEKEKMIFSPKVHSIYVDLIAKVEGLSAAIEYFDEVDPKFNNLGPSWPASLDHCV